uniref:Uncharacterized protein n=1 Tax=Caenorhabditis tropicalis TaxID=1561998 RepID=A0A1I7TKD6_9PELO
MLSIAEEASVEIESNGPSFVDPISVNGSRVSPTGEAEEATVEIESNSPSFVNPIPVNGSRVSPTREAEEATVEIESNGPLFSDPIPIGQAGESVDVSNSITPKSSRHNQDRSLQVASNSSTGDINLELDVPEHQHDDFDGYEGVRRVDLVEEAEEEEQIDHSPRSKQKSFKRRVALMSDSFASVDIPDLNRRPTRRYMGNETVEDDEWEPEKSEKKKSNRNTGLQLKKRVIIEPATPTDGVRRSKRTRVKPVRSWLNEKAVYVNSPSGGKRLTGVTDVIIKDKRLCKYRTADLKLATEREQKERAVKKKKAAEKRHQLALDHKRGKRLNESQEDILTDEEDGE